MSLVGKEIQEFSAQAYNPSTEEFVTVTDKDLRGKWSIVMFYPADFSFVCPTELEDLQVLELKCTLYQQILILFTRLGMITRIKFQKLHLR